MKFIPTSSAACTDWSASPRSTLRNSCPSDDAPKLSAGSFSPVFPSSRYSMRCDSLSIRGVREEIRLERLDRLLCRRVGAGIRQGLGGRVTIVSDRAQGGGDRREVEVAAARGTSVRIDEVDVADVRAPGGQRRGDVDLLDVHVEEVGEQV